MAFLPPPLWMVLPGRPRSGLCLGNNSDFGNDLCVRAPQSSTSTNPFVGLLVMGLTKRDKVSEQFIAESLVSAMVEMKTHLRAAHGAFPRQT